MTERRSALKSGWRRVRFGDVVRLSKARCAHPLADGLDRFVGLEHLAPGDLRIRRWGNVADGVTFTNVFKPGQVLFGKRRAYQRKVALADFGGVCSGDIYVLESLDADVLLPELLPFVCQTDAFFEHAVGTSAGSLSPRTNWKSLATFELALPPMEEQHRIVQTMTCLDEYIEACRDVQQCGATLFRSTLDHMWLSLPKRKIGDLVADGLIDPPQDGNHGEKHPKASDYIQVGGVPFVMASDLKNGQVDLDGCKKIPESLAGSLRIGFSKPGDILLSHKGTVGEVAKLNSLNTEFVMLTPQVTYYRVIDKTRLSPGWLYFAFQTPGFQRLLDQYGQQSTRAYVGITTQRDLWVPMPSLHEQEQILAGLESVEMAISAAASRHACSSALRKCFLEGEVVRMDADV